MAIYNKGSRPYRGPYSPDFKGDDVGNYQSGTNDPNAYDPTNDVAALRAGRPTAPNYDGRGIDCSSVIDAQVPSTHGFDNVHGKEGAWQTTKSDASLGGFSGPVSGLGSPSKSHPKRGQKRFDTL